MGQHVTTVAGGIRRLVACSRRPAAQDRPGLRPRDQRHPERAAPSPHRRRTRVDEPGRDGSRPAAGRGRDRRVRSAGGSSVGRRHGDRDRRRRGRDPRPDERGTLGPPTDPGERPAGAGPTRGAPDDAHSVAGLPRAALRRTRSRVDARARPTRRGRANRHRTNRAGEGAGPKSPADRVPERRHRPRELDVRPLDASIAKLTPIAAGATVAAKQLRSVIAARTRHDRQRMDDHVADQLAPFDCDHDGRGQSGRRSPRGASPAVPHRREPRGAAGVGSVDRARASRGAPRAGSTAKRLAPGVRIPTSEGTRDDQDGGRRVRHRRHGLGAVTAEAEGGDAHRRLESGALSARAHQRPRFRRMQRHLAARLPGRERWASARVPEQPTRARRMPASEGARLGRVFRRLPPAERRRNDDRRDACRRPDGSPRGRRRHRDDELHVGPRIGTHREDQDVGNVGEPGAHRPVDRTAEPAQPRVAGPRPLQRENSIRARRTATSISSRC